MKAEGNLNAEINTGKIRNNKIFESKRNLNGLESKEKSIEDKDNLQKYLKILKSNNLPSNFENYQMITSNTTSHNNVDPKIIKELHKIVNIAPTLDIQVLNSETLPKGLLININALGMTSNSFRQAFDGNTFFGVLKDPIDNEDLDGNQKLDFIIKSKPLDNINNNGKNTIEENDNNEINNNVVYGRYFRIRFDLKESSYFIKDLGSGLGTFMKIYIETKIKDNYLFNIGNSYVVCSYGLEDLGIDVNNVDNSENTLVIKLFNEEEKDQIFFYNPIQIKRIFIGRDTGCDIIINDTLLSRIHCTINYKENEGWFLYDGKFDDETPEENRQSTNGTWLCMMDETKIEEGMIFKSSHNVYGCHLHDSNNFDNK